MPFAEGGARKGAGRKPNKIKELFQEKLEGRHDEVFLRLWAIFIGYKGVKAGESVSAFQKLMDYAGLKPPEHNINENFNNNLKNVSKDELMEEMQKMMGSWTKTSEKLPKNS